MSKMFSIACIRILFNSRMIAMMVCNILKVQNTQKRAMHLQFLCAHEILYFYS